MLISIFVTRCLSILKYSTSKDVHIIFASFEDCTCSHTHVHSLRYAYVCPYPLYRMVSVHCMWPVKRAVLRWWKVCWRVEQIPTRSSVYEGRLVCSFCVFVHNSEQFCVPQTELAHHLITAGNDNKYNCNFKNCVLHCKNFMVTLFRYLSCTFPLSTSGTEVI